MFAALLAAGGMFDGKNPILLVALILFAVAAVLAFFERNVSLGLGWTAAAFLVIWHLAV